MKFKNIGPIEMCDVYGYRFRPGEVVDVVEPNLIAKFVNYTWLEVTDGLQEQREETAGEAADATEQEGVLDRDALKARADELGIEYHARIKTEHLAERIAEHGGN